MERWPHQQLAIDEATRLIDSGERRICVTSPTGGGKSLMQRDLMFWAIERDMAINYLTNRRLLFDMHCANFDKAGIEYGRRAAGHTPRYDLPIQISMIQTEVSRVLKQEKTFAHHAQLVIIDEAHQFTGDMVSQIVELHLGRGAAIVGYTATPVGLGGAFDALVVAGTNSSLRACGALVPAITYAPDEPDLRQLRAPAGTDYSPAELHKVFRRKAVFARVFEWWNKLNPDRNPTIGFGPDVAGSLWFAEMFYANGIPAAHIDGTDCWANGQSYGSSQEAREQILKDWMNGNVAILWNRFVLREGVDFPWCAHGVFATKFGALSSYLQAGGRVLRAHPSLKQVTIQDHGGNYHAHGSLNADREWSLEDTDRSIALRREELMRKQNENPANHEGEEGEPILCPKCCQPRRVIIGEDNRKCRNCGHIQEKRSRWVLQIDGSLKLQHGDVYREPKRDMRPDDEKKWRQVYYAAKNSKNGMTFRQAEGYFHAKFGFWPRRDMPMMPESSLDWDRKVRDVPWSELIPSPPQPAPQPSQQRSLVT